MYKSILFIAIAFVTFYLSSCDDDDDGAMFDYHAHIVSPSNADKHIDDTIHIEVDFESHTGEVVHHVKVRIVSAADTSVEIYNKPDVAHVHETDGMYEWSDHFVLSNANGVTANTDWILEAKVWEDGSRDQEEVSTLGFQVLP